jgi:hypothetical protein
MPPLHIGVGKILGFNPGGNPGIAHRRCRTSVCFVRSLAIADFAWSIARNASDTEGDSQHEDECAASLAHGDFPLNILKLQK